MIDLEDDNRAKQLENDIYHLIRLSSRLAHQWDATQKRLDQIMQEFHSTNELIRQKTKELGELMEEDKWA